jgi:hypothetical protein
MGEARPSKDVFANLLRDSRGLRRDQARAREHWFQGLSWERKEETLFELEMLLKGLASFANPRNHPGPPPRTRVVAQDFRPQLYVVREGLDESVRLIRALLGERDRAFSFSRYLESVLPEDSERTRLIHEQLSQDTPEESLFLLRNSFTDLLEMTDGLLRLSRAGHRQNQALMALVIREIGRNVYFNPLVALEFRPEYDRIREPAVLEALDAVESEAAHRVVALVFLTCYRSLRYIRLVERHATDFRKIRRSYLLLAVLRSDMRALTRFVDQHSARLMANGLERELLQLTAGQVSREHERLAHRAGELASLRASLTGLSSAIRVETRRIYELEIPGPEAADEDRDLGAEMIVVAASLRATLEHVIRTLCIEIRPGAAPPELAEGSQAKRATGERLRRDVWMFARVLRGFLAKAESARDDADRWDSATSFQFVQEFLAHFRTIGYHLVRSSDYDRLDAFVSALGDLHEVDLMTPERLSQAVRESRAFLAFLDELFEGISQRAELKDVPFNRKAAADTLRAYLADR